LAYELTATNLGLYLASYILFTAGLATLLLSTIGFLGMAYVSMTCRLDPLLNPVHSGQNTYSEIPRVTVFFRSFGILALVGLGLNIAGGILGSHVSPKTANAGYILRRAGASVFGLVYILILLAFFGTFSYRWHLRSYRRNVSPFIHSYVISHQTTVPPHSLSIVFFV